MATVAVGLEPSEIGVTVEQNTGINTDLASNNDIVSVGGYIEMVTRVAYI